MMGTFVCVVRVAKVLTDEGRTEDEVDSSLSRLFLFLKLFHLVPLDSHTLVVSRSTSTESVVGEFGSSINRNALVQRKASSNKRSIRKLRSV